MKRVIFVAKHDIAGAVFVAKHDIVGAEEAMSLLETLPDERFTDCSDFRSDFGRP